MRKKGIDWGCKMGFYEMTVNQKSYAKLHNDFEIIKDQVPSNF